MGGLEWRSDGDEIRVLCLDDDEDVLRLTERQLDGAQQSLQVRTARTVGEARAAFDETVDCVVADYRLPDGIGLELLETVREDHPDLLFFLVTNAVEHGGETVRVEYRDGTIAVADDGPGVPPSERDSIFDPGYTTVADGTGFGLSIVRTVAEAHGWTVSVTESEWGGARFEVSGLEEL